MTDEPERNAAWLLKLVVREISYLESQLRKHPSNKFTGALTAYNQVRIWIQREHRKNKKRP